MERLMYVAHQMNQELECLLPVGAFQRLVADELAKSLDACDHAIAGLAVSLGIVAIGVEWDIHVMPGTGGPNLITRVVGPIRDCFVRDPLAFAEQLRDSLLGVRSQIEFRDETDDLMPLLAPSPRGSRERGNSDQD